MKKLWLLFGALFSFAASAGYPGSNPLISADELLTKLEKKQNVIVLDVRSAGEFSEGHVPTAVNIPYDEIKEKAGKHIKNKEQQIVVYCRSGYRASKAETALADLGYSNILHLDGDMLGWKSNKKPLEN